MAGAYLVLRLVTGSLLLLAAIEKLGHFKDFVGAIREYRLLPAAAIPGTAVGVTLAELVVGGCLVGDFATGLAALAAAILFLVFACALALNLMRGNRVPCHCFGANDSEPISVWNFLRSVVFLLASLAVFVFAGAQRALVAPSDLLPLLTLAAGGLIVTRLLDALPSAWRQLSQRAPEIPASPVISWKQLGLNASLKAIPSDGDTQ